MNLCISNNNGNKIVHGVTFHSKIATSLSVIQAYEIKHRTNSFTVSTTPAVINLFPSSLSSSLSHSPRAGTGGDPEHFPISARAFCLVRFSLISPHQRWFSPMLQPPCLSAPLHCSAGSLHNADNSEEGDHHFSL